LERRDVRATHQFGCEGLRTRRVTSYRYERWLAHVFTNTCTTTTRTTQLTH